jgi:glycosyltransferase involved in cell wall biosynthesis
MPVFFACGRFVEKKAPHLTILAFHKAWQKNPDLRLRMAGDGQLMRPCQDLVKSLNLRDAVKFLGIIEPATVSKELRACRAFVQHSVVASDGDSEGTPVGILEAGCSGIPVIATRHAGIIDAVIENVTGLLVDEQDIDAMADAMLTLAEDPQRAGTMGQNARKHVLQSYTLETSIDKLRALLYP